MEQLITYTNYKEYKAAVDEQWSQNEQKAGELVEGFAVIGYLLKQARDTDILKNSGYKNVNEFAEAEYRIDKTIVSRYIGINDRFSELGNSKQLKENYRGIGYAKLILMLQMPDEINEEITPTYSKAEIQTIKDEVDEEKKRTDLEVLMEGENERQKSMHGNLGKAIHQLCHDDPTLYIRLYGSLKKGKEAVWEDLAPGGESIKSIRIQGVGRMMLSIKGTDQDVSLINLRSNEKELHKWDQVLNAIEDIVDYEKSAEEAWKTVYGETFPKQPEVAPVQQLPEEKKPLPKKPSKVTRAKTEMPRSNPIQEKLKPEENQELKEESEAEKEQESQVKTGKEEEIKQPEVAPVQPETEDPVENHEPIFLLREDAESYLERINAAMEENQYFLAKNETKHLLETLVEICEVLDQKEIDGQMKIQDYIEE